MILWLILGCFAGPKLGTWEFAYTSDDNGCGEDLSGWSGVATLTTWDPDGYVWQGTYSRLLPFDLEGKEFQGMWDENGTGPDGSSEGFFVLEGNFSTSTDASGTLDITRDCMGYEGTFPCASALEFSASFVY